MNNRRKPIEILIDAAMTCCKCGAKMGRCDCYEKCSCGWWADKGKPCNNPETTLCSTKIKYGDGGGK